MATLLQVGGGGVRSEHVARRPHNQQVHSKPIATSLDIHASTLAHRWTFCKPNEGEPAIERKRKEQDRGKRFFPKREREREQADGRTDGLDSGRG